ncbi:hypothetical protein MLD38_033669 [Melastoma candidum]|uniref:Uncharacterized protein n=1 Tax=Melastoma candidum TaxID=119954 RepID=A0ACB9M840_9MYRT|nr:hypothetical protein MLD38_033669 [Melastoma candidum]
MASASRLSYQRLRNDDFSPDHDDILERYRHRSIAGSSIWWRFRRFRSRRRFRVKVPGLRRFQRRRGKFVAAVRVSCGKVIKRLKESRSHFGDLFAGNYLFLQVNPTPLKSAAIKKSYEVHQAFPGIPSAIEAPRVTLY